MLRQKKTLIVETRLFPDCRYAAITLFGVVFTRDKRFVDKQTANHELIHCQQQMEWLYLPFFVLYAAEWLWHLLRLRDAFKAYKSISFEREAYAHAADYDYPHTRKHFANYSLCKE